MKALGVGPWFDLQRKHKSGRTAVVKCVARD
jgi:hypothetical protein